MIELKTWKVLVTFEECGTLTKTANLLHISQPALSKTLVHLEQDLGLALFDRSKNNQLLLTPIGKQAAKYAKELLEHAKSIEDALHHSSLFQFGSCAPAPAWIFEAILKEHHYHDIQYKLENDPERLIQQVTSGQVQLVILPFDPQNQDLYAKCCMSESLSFAVPKCHPLNQKEVITFDDLIGQNVLLYREIGYWNEVVKERLSQTHFISIDHRSTFEETLGLNAFPYFTTSGATENPNPNVEIKPFDQMKLDYWFVCLQKNTQTKQLIQNLKYKEIKQKDMQFTAHYDE